MRGFPVLISVFVRTLILLFLLTSVGNLWMKPFALKLVYLLRNLFAVGKFEFSIFFLFRYILNSRSL